MKHITLLEKNKTFVPVFYRRIKYVYELGCVWITSRLR